jgi:hypothetical protein
MSTETDIANTLDTVASISEVAVAPLTGANPEAAAGIAIVAGLTQIAARLLRDGVQDPVAHITRALDIASRVAAQEAAGEAALEAKFGDTTPPDSSGR